MSVSDPPPPGFAEEVWFKNRLQQYTHRASIPLPVYQTFNESAQHAPRFRSRVWVDGTCFTSPNTFSNRKMAEQDVAKHALIGMQEKVKNEEPSRLLEDTIFCKSIINEYVLKMNLETPVYETKESKAMLPIFVSSLVLNGVTYDGDVGKNKKEAEQFAARVAILSILKSESSTAMSEIVKSKSKFYDALKIVKDSSSVLSDTMPVGMNPPEHFMGLPSVQSDNMTASMNQCPEDIGATSPVNKRKEIHSSGVECITLPAGANLVAVHIKDSSSVQGGNVRAALNPSEDIGLTFSVNKRKEVHSSSAQYGTMSDGVNSLERVNDSFIIQGGNARAGVNPSEDSGAIFSFNKIKEVNVSGGTITGPSAANSQHSLLASFPSIEMMHPQSSLEQVSVVQATHQSHNFKKRKSETSSAAIAPPTIVVPPEISSAPIAPQIVFVSPKISSEIAQPIVFVPLETPSAAIAPPAPPPASEQAPICSNSRKKRNRKNKKAKKLTSVSIPQNPVHASSVAN